MFHDVINRVYGCRGTKFPNIHIKGCFKAEIQSPRSKI